VTRPPSPWTRLGDTFILGLFGTALRIAVLLLRRFRRA
jgi:hypothetical protein